MLCNKVFGGLSFAFKVKFAPEVDDSHGFRFKAPYGAVIIYQLIHNKMLVDVVNVNILKNLFIILMLISFFISLGCVGKDEKLSEEEITQMVRQTPVVIGEEKIGGKYNASILNVRTAYKDKEWKWQQIE